jgi:beta-1,4-mannosyltransferase
LTSSVARQSGAITVGSWPGRFFEENPFIGVFCSSLERAGAIVIDVGDTTRPLPPMDILHIHWPDLTFWWASSPRNAVKRCALTLVQIARLKRAGAKVVWMVHDLEPLDAAHARSLTWKVYIAALSRMVDGFMTLSPQTVAPVQAAYPALARLPYAAPHHPRYDIAAATFADGSAKAALGWGEDVTVFTFFGQIRPAKGVIALARAFAALPGDHYRLIIAGNPSDKAYIDQIRAALVDEPRVTFRLGYVAEADAARIAAATDAFVLPFRDSLHSGTLIYSISAGRPALTPDSPYARGVDHAVGAGWITRYEGDLTPAVLAAWRPPVRPANLEAFSADRLGEAAMELCQRLRASE